MITLNTLSEATEQQVFDQVAAHLLTQNNKSRFGMTCLYRAEDLDGNILKCAAGVLIADDEYHEGMEDKSWRCLVSEDAVPEAHADFIVALQNVHDDCDIEDWPAFLESIARERGLNINVLEKFKES